MNESLLSCPKAKRAKAALVATAAIAVPVLSYRHVFLHTLLLVSFTSVSAEYLIGVGKADITGPAAQTEAMGYGKTAQVLNGIHTRLWARAFLMGHPTETEYETHATLGS